MVASLKETEAMQRMWESLASQAHQIPKVSCVLGRERRRGWRGGGASRDERMDSLGKHLRGSVAHTSTHCVLIQGVMVSLEENLDTLTSKVEKNK